jgi:hypothetical protein
LEGAIVVWKEYSVLDASDRTGYGILLPGILTTDTPVPGFHYSIRAHPGHSGTGTGYLSTGTMSPKPAQCTRLWVGIPTDFPGRYLGTGTYVGYNCTKYKLTPGTITRYPGTYKVLTDCNCNR